MGDLIIIPVYAALILRQVVFAESKPQGCTLGPPCHERRRPRQGIQVGELNRSTRSLTRDRNHIGSGPQPTQRSVRLHEAPCVHIGFIDETVWQPVEVVSEIPTSQATPNLTPIIMVTAGNHRQQCLGLGCHHPNLTH